MNVTIRFVQVHQKMIRFLKDEYKSWTADVFRGKAGIVHRFKSYFENPVNLKDTNQLAAQNAMSRDH